jgi:hypothetical protein
MHKILVPIIALIACLFLSGCACYTNDPHARMDSVTAGLLGGPFEIISDIGNPRWDWSGMDGQDDAERAQIYQEREVALVYAEVEKANVVARRDETLRLDEPTAAEYWTMPAWQYPLTY